MAAVAAAGAAQLALAVLTVLNRIALVVGWTGLLCLAVVLVRLACAVRGDMRLARKRKRFPEPELGDDVLDTIALWHQAEFDEGLERLLTDEEKRRGRVHRPPVRLRRRHRVRGRAERPGCRAAQAHRPHEPRPWGRLPARHVRGRRRDHGMAQACLAGGTSSMTEFKRRQYGRNHSYYLDGQKLAGVTTILGDGLAKPALVSWGINTTAGYAADHWDELAELPVSKRIETLKKAPYADRDAAAKRGTEVHRLAELLGHGKEVTVPDELAGHVESYVRFLDEFEPEPVHLETACVNLSQWPYAGTFDGILDIKGRGRLLVDIKTARSGVFPDNALQLAAYRNATHFADPEDGWELHPMPQVDGCAVIHVRADGYDLVPVETGPTVFRAFRYAQQMHSWANDLSKTVVGEAIAPPVRSNT